jgi:tRNA (guanine-N7-)-methyltransferase
VRLRTNHRRLAALEDYVGKELLTGEIEQYKGKWQEMLGNNPLALEIGCGKGAFITGMAALHPEISFLGIESQKEVCYYAVKKIREQKLPNVKIIFGNAENLCAWFAPGEVAKLYLNFSDPWPKTRHAKRRLTYRSFLSQYKNVLVPQGHLRFKTDNDALFDFSLEEFKAFGLKFVAQTTDLHHSAYDNEVQTEYETRFSKLGKNINFCEVVF